MTLNVFSAHRNKSGQLTFTDGATKVRREKSVPASEPLDIQP